MPSSKNVDSLGKINESLDASKGLFLVDYSGLSVKETQELRRKLTGVGAHMKVYKNNLVKLALEEHKMPNIDNLLAGTCACVFYENDPVEPAKVIKNTNKELDKLEFIGGISDGQAIDAKQAQAIADLPSREELIAKLAGALCNPLRGIASVCAGPARGFATALSAVVDQKNAA